jgi:hypothetical protein
MKNAKASTFKSLTNGKKLKLIYEENRFNGVVQSKILIFKRITKIQGAYNNLIAVILLLALFFLIIITTAAILLAFYSRLPGHLNEDCIMRSCNTKLGLKCIDRICQCPADHYYKNKCYTLKGYNEYCKKENECKKDLICFNGKCVCEQIRYWTGIKCDLKSSYGESCDRKKCNEHLMLTCDPSLRMCTCNSSRFWSGEACYRKRTNGEICFKLSACREYKGLMCVRNTCLCNETHQYFDGSICRDKRKENETCTFDFECLGNMTCISSNNACNCPSNYYFNESILSCVPKTQNNTVCFTDWTCRTDLGLSCQAGLCQCSLLQFWYQNKCSDPLNYSNAGCTSDSHCLSSLGLICNGYSANNPCNCPSASTVGMCDCPFQNGNEMYWNGTQCVQRLDENEICDQQLSYQCLSGLKCDKCSKVCINESKCSSGWVQYFGRCYLLLKWRSYAAGKTECLNVNPAKKSDLATVPDQDSIRFLQCKFTFTTWTYILSAGSATCKSHTVNSGVCPILDVNSDCLLHSCSCPNAHDALCDYLI